MQYRAYGTPILAATGDADGNGTVTFADQTAVLADTGGTMDSQAIRESVRAKLATKHLEIAESLPSIDSQTSLRSEAAIGSRLLAMHAVAAVAYGLPRETATVWLQDHALMSWLTDHELRFLGDSKEDALPFQLQIEGIAALCWVLGLITALDPFEACSATLVEQLPDLRCAAQPSAFWNRVSMRAQDQIREALDLYYCMHWYIESRRLVSLPSLVTVGHHVIVERRRALEWVLSDDRWDRIALDT